MLQEYNTMGGIGQMSVAQAKRRRPIINGKRRVGKIGADGAIERGRAQ